MLVLLRCFSIIARRVPHVCPQGGFSGRGRVVPPVWGASRHRGISARNISDFYILAVYWLIYGPSQGDWLMIKGELFDIQSEPV